MFANFTTEIKKLSRAVKYLLFFSFLINILMLPMSVYSLQVLDRVLTSASLPTLVSLSVITFLTFIFLAIFQMIRSFVLQEISNEFNRNFSYELFQKAIVSSNVNCIQVMRDFGVVKNFISSQSITYIFDIPFSIIYFAAIFFIHPINGFIVLGSAVLLILLSISSELTLKKHVTNIEVSQIALDQNLMSISRNTDTINAMGMQNAITDYWHVRHDSLSDSVSSSNYLSNAINSITKSFRMFIQMVTMAISAYLVIFHKMSAGGIIATSILSGKALAPFDSLTSVWKSYIHVRESYNRLMYFIRSVDFSSDKMQLPPPTGAISLEGISYGTSDKIILNNVSCEIAAGEVVGVIGPSGCGKTTLVRIILNLIAKHGGTVRYDAVDVNHLHKHNIGRFIGFLPQSIELFSGTIKQNIARMQADAPDEEILKAAEFTGNHEFILSFPNGYNQDIGVNGSFLSFGQKQRIALARAFFGMPKIVVLDEPNSNMDRDGEIALEMSLRNAKLNGVTVLIVSHKPSLLVSSDKILILDGGRMVAFDDAKKILSSLHGK